MIEEISKANDFIGLTPFIMVDAYGQDISDCFYANLKTGECRCHVKDGDEVKTKTVYPPLPFTIKTSSKRTFEGFRELIRKGQLPQTIKEVRYVK